MALKQISYDNNNFNISYEIINPIQKDVIVFLHGWGSNKEIMKQAFENRFQDFKHIYVDMAGFGKSSCDVVLDTYKYSKTL